MNTPQSSTVLPPIAPATINETGMSATAVAELVTRILYFHGEQTAQGLLQISKLTYDAIIKPTLEFLMKEQMAARTGSRGVGELGYAYVLTQKGLLRARELIEINQYSGAAPVTLAEYHAVVQAQTITKFVVDDKSVERAMSHLVLSRDIFEQLGPAANSAASIFLYGPSGNGKTVIAEALASVLAGEIYIPHAIQVEGYIIKVFDPLNHQPVSLRQGGRPDPLPMVGAEDQRWVKCRRPSITIGGELTLEMLELLFDPVSKNYEAPLQMKANGGAFIIDDFGRQRVHPRDLLNRWIVPLEKRIDYLTLLRGKKVDVPFDVLIFFSTNLKPTELADEAFLRRIQHKIAIKRPTREQFREIMTRNCQSLGVPFSEDGFAYLLKEQYDKPGRELAAVHPRDVLKQIIDIARYLRVTPAMTPDLLDRACRSYFVELL